MELALVSALEGGEVITVIFNASIRIILVKTVRTSVFMVLILSHVSMEEKWWAYLEHVSAIARKVLAEVTVRLKINVQLKTSANVKMVDQLKDY